MHMLNNQDSSRRGLMVTIIFFISLTAVSVSMGQWSRISAIPVGDVPSLFINGNTVYAGTDSAVFISSDGGNAWKRSATIPNSPIYVDAVTSFGGKIYVGTGGDGVYVSADDGASWQPLSAGLGGAGSGFISSFAERSGVLYAATMGGGVFALQQNTWAQVGDLPGQQAGNTYALLAKGDTLFAAAGANGYVWRLPPDSTNWQPLLVSPVVGAEHVISSLILWNGIIYAGGTYGIFRSSDNGEMWEFSGYGTTVNRHVGFAPFGNRLYASFSAAATQLYSSLNGNDWSLVELTNYPFTYRIGSTSTKLFAARIDGLWFNPAPTTSVKPPAIVPDQAVLHPAYPNPFNPTTTISFQLPVSTWTTLKVYNMMGQETATLVDEPMQPGFHNLRWNAEGHPSGVYFYRLTAGSFVGTRKLILIR